MKKHIKTMILLTAVLAVVLIPLQGAFAAGNDSSCGGIRITYGDTAWKEIYNRVIQVTYNGNKWTSVWKNPGFGTNPAVPTAKPAPAPTAQPTPAPTAQPTPAPTAQPTPAPTPKPTQNPGQSSGYSLSAEEQKMVNLVNQERQKAGVAPLTVDPELSRVARIKSQDMKDNGYFSHTSPTYGSPFDMMKQFGISYRSAGENIALHGSVESAHAGLMNSEGHRKNILNPSFTHIGIGIVDNRYYTQMFIGK